MGLSSFLQGFFPHRWLNKKGTGNIRLFNGLGTTLDWANSFVILVRNESRVLTAVDTIPLREKELGITSDPSVQIDVRRSGIIARMREQSRPMTAEDLATALQSYGIVVSIQHDYANYKMFIKILNVNGVPEGYPQIQAFIREVVRAHVEVIFQFRYLTIAETESMTISQIEATTLDRFAGGGV
ncbi:putative phage tail protein [Paenibacillus rigui]|uniref:Uncharacterized protein n=1 Tax=Paenibacillus rigui TaxID=554312 RepID=A0A229UMS5_9BACL|nr:putative phage tail protein [Paenibacillus rigui]OXM84614.1 hypothetical protein CF651_19095 [Paenibacillus rigui]